MARNGLLRKALLLFTAPVFLSSTLCLTAALWFAAVESASAQLPAQSPTQAPFDPSAAGSFYSQQPFASPLDNPFNDRAASIVVEQPSAPIAPMRPIEPDLSVAGVQPAYGTPMVVQDDDIPRDSRSGFFQSLNFSDTYMPRNGSHGMMIDDGEATVVVGLPLPTRSCPLLIMPGFAAHFFDGPDDTPVPARTFDAYVQFRWIPRVATWLRFDMAITPGYFGDFDNDGHKAIRETGYFTGILEFSREFQVVLGADYTDRHDYPVLPIAGVIWKPDDNAEYRLVFPQPRIAFRLAADGIYLRENDPLTTNYGFEWWTFVGGEIGGETWAVQRAGVGADLMSYSDLRALLGVEHKVYRGLGSKIEVGYSFNRKVLFDSDGLESYPSSTVIARATLRY